MQLRVLYLCFGTFVVMEVCFLDWQAFLLESEFRLLKLVLGASLGLDGEVSGTGDLFWCRKLIYF